MGPASRCIGNTVSKSQPWQLPLLPTATPRSAFRDFNTIRDDVITILNQDANYVGKFARLAWRCISTFRSSDFVGGCNGARIRFSPQKGWQAKKNLDKVLNVLNPVKEKFGPSLSWSDLIVFAGNVAIVSRGAAHEVL